MVSVETLLPPPDPGQVKEQPLPLGQEYRHSEATSNPLGGRDGPAPMRPSSCADRDAEGQTTNRAAPITSAQKLLDAIPAFLFRYSKNWRTDYSKRTADELTVDRHLGAAWVASGGNQEARVGVPTGNLSGVLKHLL
jgi:hypothetical protein